MEVFLRNKNYYIALLGLMVSFYCVAQIPRVRTEHPTDKGCKYAELTRDSNVESRKNLTITWDGECKDGFISGAGTLVIKNPNGNIQTIKTIYQDGLENGSGEEISESSVGKTIFKGEWVGGLRTGFGKLTYASGGIYEGEFNDRTRTKKGKYTDPKGGVFEGEFNDELKTRKGKYVHPNGDIYEGNYVNNLRHGKGKITSGKNGASYEGDFFENKIQGKGIQKFTSGHIEEGDFKDGKLNGSGFIKFDYGTSEGNYINSLLDGKGKIVLKDGKVIEGIFSKNILTNGKIIFPSGEIQAGEFEGGRLNGKGKLVRKDGTILEGNFNYGSLGNGKIIFSTGVIDEGNFTNLQERPNQLVETVLNGLGTRISIGGDIYKGNWANGVMTGEATIQYKNGNTYTGKVTYPIANGQGKMTYANGFTYEGLFKDSKRWGVFSVTAKDGKKTIQTYQDDVLVPTVTSISTNSSSSSLNAPANSISSDNSLLDFEDAKKKCASIGFKPATEQFGKCVLKFTK